MDVLGPFLGRMILVVTDAHSKWPEAISMNSTTAGRTIAALREVFARNGLPRTIYLIGRHSFTHLINPLYHLPLFPLVTSSMLDIDIARANVET